MKRTLLKQGTILLCFALCACTPTTEPSPIPTTLPATAEQTMTPALTAPASTEHMPTPIPKQTPLPEQTAPLIAGGWQMARFDTQDPHDGAPLHWQQIVKNSRFSLGRVRLSYDPNTQLQTPIEIGLGTYPSIDGSTVARPMAEEFARQHLGLGDGQSLVAFNTTHHAYENLIRDENNWGKYVEPPAVLFTNVNVPITQIRPVHVPVELFGTDLFIGTAPSADELQMAKEYGVELVMEPVCCDAFVFITYPGNPVKNLTIQQIRNIYTGKITNWKELGGEDLPITAYVRDKNSGSQTAMEELVMQGTPIEDSIANEEEIDEMSGLVRAVGQRGSLGYTYKYYLFQAFSEQAFYSPETLVETLAIDGVAPTSAHIADQSYPFAIHYYGVIRKGDEQAPGGLFLDWMRSDEGQACIKQAGYIALDGSESSFYYDENGFVFPDSSQRLLTENDYWLIRYHAYSVEQVAELFGLARNEIFARHGNAFKSALYADHYAQYDWYNALPKRTVALEDLSEIEQANVRYIQEWEKEWVE